MITGQTNISVKNVVDICKINFKNKILEIHKDDKKYINQDKINFLFGSINIHTKSEENKKWKDEYYNNQLNNDELKIFKENLRDRIIWVL